MLIDFSLRNFGSIKDHMSLSAETGERLSRLKETNTIKENYSSLLKNLIIIGPNGSGKSTLIEAIKLMREMVLTDAPNITTKLPYNPFRLNDLKESIPTVFEIKFNFENKAYDYSFSYTSDSIVQEELKELLKSGEKTIFQRNNQEYPILDHSLIPVAESTKKNSLFLYSAQNANNHDAISAFRWFQDNLIFVDDHQLIPENLAVLMNNSRVKTEFLRFLHFADFNITDVNFHEVPMVIPKRVQDVMNLLEPGKKIPKAIPQLFAVHKKYNSTGDVVGSQEIPLSNESRGTQKIFLIALSIINAQLNGNGKTILFDEFDDSLHFALSKAIIQIFNSTQNKNQFIMTTHELQLLNAQLRTDQIYLMEKDFQGKSSLSSVFDFKDSRDTARHDVHYMKRYVEGRFGAFPEISVNEMLSALDANGLSGKRK
ncbi:AAA family ATPase [Lacticaseibacillus paracasei]|uniref:AAA family ATPase n=1 Tax=Lacticaseibacillus paracasei TaxID=1597 RepID=UPI00124B4936|nr:ATP-binding protein [Lacticaseibacillus paracasei]KAB1963545.1 AAA family ATPase [Lacticaseibacillus paracasei]MCT3331710.1 ATP-binding protein [Lacticaseibacillus paracasei]